MKKANLLLAVSLLSSALLCGCSRTPSSSAAGSVTPADETPEPTGTPSPTPTPSESPEPSDEPSPEPAAAKLIVLDPGHTSMISNESEPLGPGSAEMKAKDAIGTTGVATGAHEYDLNLQVCEKLKSELQARGYQVLLTHETNDVMISCAERAQIANDNHADVFLRVHADGSESPSAAGAMTICTTAASPFHPELYQQSRLLSDDLVNTYCAVTGMPNRGVWETDSMTGNNWSEVPVTLIELGFMTNPDEDVWMNSEEGQSLMVKGISDGLDAYFTDIGA